MSTRRRGPECSSSLGTWTRKAGRFHCRPTAATARHLVYAIDCVPVEDEGLIERCLKALAAEHNDESVKIDTSVHNPARIWKLYGTLSSKGDHTDDRPHRVAHIINLPEDFGAIKVTREQLEVLAAKGPQRAAQPHVGNGQQAGGFDLEGFIANYLPEAIGPKTYNRAGNFGGCRSAFQSRALATGGVDHQAQRRSDTSRLPSRVV